MCFLGKYIIKSCAVKIPSLLSLYATFGPTPFIYITSTSDGCFVLCFWRFFSSSFSKASCCKSFFITLIKCEEGQAKRKVPRPHQDNYGYRGRYQKRD